MMLTGSIGQLGSNRRIVESPRIVESVCYMKIKKTKGDMKRIETVDDGGSEMYQEWFSMVQLFRLLIF